MNIHVNKVISKIKEITDKFSGALKAADNCLENSNRYKIKITSIIFALIFTALKFWLTSAQTMTVLTDAIHDDRLFVNLAENIANGKWLGEYNHLTLIKGMFYPLWIALMSKLHIPLLLSHQLLYAAGCLIFIIALRHNVRNPLTLLFIYLILLFNPMSYSFQFLNIIREDIIQSQTILIFALLTGLFLRSSQYKKSMYLWAAGLGITTAAFWLTREDSVWILPSILLIILIITIKTLYEYKAKAVKMAVILLIPFIIFFISLGTVAALNKIHYGIFVTSEFKSKNFKAAYGALTRVRNENWYPQIPVPKEVRMKIYPFSPAFSELKPYLEGNVGAAWTHFSNLITGLNWTENKKKKNEMIGGVFMWALRDAVNEAGYYKTAQTADNFYRRMAEEINRACDEKKLPCINKREAFIPPFNINYLPLFFDSFPKMFLFAVRFDEYDPESMPSTGNTDDLVKICKFTNDKAHGFAPAVQEAVKYGGWIFHKNKKLNLSVRNKKFTIFEIKLKTTDSPDVYEHLLATGKNSYLNARNARFNFEIYDSKNSCLSVSYGSRVIKKIPLDGSIKTIARNGLYFNLDYIKIPDSQTDNLSKPDKFKLKILDTIAGFYRKLFPYIFFLALFIFIIRFVLIFFHHNISKVRIIQLSAAGAVLSRFIILVLFDITSFVAKQPRYLAPVYPMLLIFIIFEFLVKDKDNYISWKKKRSE